MIPAPASTSWSAWLQKVRDVSRATRMQCYGVYILYTCADRVLWFYELAGGLSLVGGSLTGAGVLDFPLIGSQVILKHDLPRRILTLLAVRMGRDAARAAYDIYVSQDNSLKNNRKHPK